MRIFGIEHELCDPSARTVFHWVRTSVFMLTRSSPDVELFRRSIVAFAALSQNYEYCSRDCRVCPTGAAATLRNRAKFVTDREQQGEPEAPNSLPPVARPLRIGRREGARGARNEGSRDGKSVTAGAIGSNLGFLRCTQDLRRVGRLARLYKSCRISCIYAHTPSTKSA